MLWEKNYPKGKLVQEKTRGRKKYLHSFFQWWWNKIKTVLLRSGMNWINEFSTAMKLHGVTRSIYCNGDIWGTIQRTENYSYIILSPITYWAGVSWWTKVGIPGGTRPTAHVSSTPPATRWSIITKISQIRYMQPQAVAQVFSINIPHEYIFQVFKLPPLLTFDRREDFSRNLEKQKKKHNTKSKKLVT